MKRNEKTNAVKRVARRMLAVAVMTFMLTGLTACGQKDDRKSITVEVQDADGKVSTYEAKTDAENLYDAIVEDVSEVTLDGYESDYGFYVTAVNGIVADYETDGAYWSIYVNGVSGSYGIESQPVTDGDTYKFAYEVYVAE